MASKVSKEERTKFLNELTLLRNKKTIEVEQLDVSHPIYKKFARVNGEINQMDVEQLGKQLRQMGLETDGSEASCKTRIKHFFRDEVNDKIQLKPKAYAYDVICVVDFEATCEKENETKDVQEIIEFPAFIVDVHKRTIVSTFHQYVKPQVNPKLSKFCTELTGITQSVVNGAETFETVLNRFEDWFYSFLIDNGHKSFAIATDGYVQFIHRLVHVLT